ncbi:Heat shock 70 kDa protein 12A [Nibea albiflora]|uniref:Heat shock 70 kDa protein 12A n=1 Tax=Nibea albiflora TaxID=240163 RepID=A0ACB7ECU5_NIBAL|nr:Heat shock 70 kDa protein 12A [Nibea albiflora]
MSQDRNLCLVSQFAVEEFEALQDTLNLERDLRTEAENFARVMLVEQKQLKRQSQILMQTSSPTEALQEALSQVRGLTQDLETQRLEHQNQMKQMEDRLRSCETQRALTALRRKLELVEEERREYSDKCSKTEVEVKDLRFTVEELQKKLQAATNPTPTPAPPPPPPPPPPSAPLASNPLSSLLALIQKRKASSTDIPLVVQDSAKTPEVDIKQQAVEEMIQRIKKGVQLRPVRQSPNSTRRQENFSRTTPHAKAVSLSTNHDEELQRILLRRRDALESQHSNDTVANPSPAKSMGDPGITPLSPSHTQQNDTDQVPSGPSFVVVVAIDFGTTSSGYAYAFTKEPECIHTMRRWEGGDPGVSNQKTPTTILLTPDRKFHSFGYAARDFYHDLDPSESKHWLYLEKFKMKLHTTANLSIDTDLHAANGKRVKALDIFAYALAFFKEQALKELSDQTGGEFDNNDVRWVITVPAIWKMPAKQFMREAAYKSALVSRENPEQLIIALEPEAASIYCRKLRLHQMVDLCTQTTQNGFSPSENVGSGMTQAKEHVRRNRQSRTFLVENVIGELWSELEEGDRYVVVDCGGGTVDLTVHQIRLPEGHLKELYKASGGPYGSLGIDYEFEKLLCKIFGQDFIDQFKIKRPAAWVDLMIAFESRKRAAAPDRTNPLNINLPFSFIDYYKKFRGHSVEHALRKSNVDFVKWSSQGMLRMSPDAMNSLFKPTIDHIIQHLTELFEKPEVSDIKFLFLVGGFAESPLLQQAVQNMLQGRSRIIIPHDVGLTILKGAVLFGLDPSVIKVRRSPLTYGVGVLNRFVEGKHPPEKLLVKDGTRWCTDVFDTFIAADQSVALGEMVKRSYTPAKPSQQVIVIHVYCTEKETAGFISEPGVRKCGTLRLDVSGTESTAPRREIQTLMQFGDTEIRAMAVDVSTGRTVKASIDFLSH